MASMHHDPADVQEYSDRHQARAQRDEKGDFLVSSGHAAILLRFCPDFTFAAKKIAGEWPGFSILQNRFPKPTSGRITNAGFNKRSGDKTHAAVCRIHGRYYALPDTLFSGRSLLGWQVGEG